MSSTLMGKLVTSFENSQKYFEEIPNVIIGRVPKGPRENPNEKNSIIPWTIVGGKDITYDITNFKKRFTLKSLDSKSIMSKKTSQKSELLTSTINQPKQTLNISNQLNNIQTKPNYVEYVDDKKISQIYERFKNKNYFDDDEQDTKGYLKKNNNTQIFSKILETSINTEKTEKNTIERQKFQNTNAMPEEIVKRLNFQEKTLMLLEENRKKRIKIENYLKIKTNKSSEELTLNSGNSHLMKKELISLIDAKIPTEEKNGIYNWIISLRRPKNFVGDRYAYINYGSNNNPFWNCYKDSSPSKKEKIIVPNYKIKDNLSLVEILKKNEKIIGNNQDVVDEIEKLDNNIVFFL